MFGSLLHGLIADALLLHEVNKVLGFHAAEPTIGVVNHHDFFTFQLVDGHQ